MNTPTDAFCLALCKSIGGDTTLLSGAKVGLISSPFTPARNLNLSDLTEANYDGYMRIALWTPPSENFISSDGFDYSQASTAAVFAPTGSDTPNTIYGYFTTFGSDSTKLGYVEPINPPITLNGPTTAVTIQPRIGVNPILSWGNGVVSS